MSVEANMKKKKWKAQFLTEMKTENNIKNTAIKTVVETGLSVLVGGAIGSFVGRPSFVAGLALTAAGYYLGASWVPPIGIGMMASSNVMGVNQMSGFTLKDGTDRLVSFKDSLLHRTYLDKLFKSGTATKDTDETTSGFGDVEEHNLALSDVERQLEESATKFQQRNGGSTAGLDEDVQGTEEPDFSGM